MFEGEQRRQAILVAISVILLTVCGVFILAGRAVSAQTAPPAPVLVSPQGAVFTTTVTYTWQESSGAVDYRLLVIDSSSTQVHNQWYLTGDVCGGGTCSVSPAGPLALDGYSWYVKARNGDGSTESTPGWFYVAAEVAPAIPNLRQPSGTIADNQPSYRWDHVGEAVEYQLLVVGADSVQYVNTWFQAVDICTATLCDVPQPTPLPEQGYTWYVRARNPYGFNWSPGKLFNVFFGARPVAPTLLAPSGVISETTPAYDWSDEGDAQDYMLLVVDSDRNRELHDWYLAAGICDTVTCTVSQPSALPDDTYNWYLKARNPAGATWAAPGRFTLFSGGPVGPVMPISPTGTISQTTPTYTWTEAADAVNYQLWIFNDAGSLLMNAWYLASDICGGGSCATAPAMVLSEGDYSWQLKARNPLGAVWSPRHYFTVAQTPPDLELVKDNPVSGAFPGDTITYTLTYSNTGGAVAAGVVLSDTVPENSSFYPAGSSPGWTQVGSTSHYTHSLGSLGVGARGVVTFSIMVDDPLPPGTEYITNAASISDDGSQGPDPVPDNNVAVETTPLAGGPTFVCEAITENTTWTLSDSPYA